MLSTEAHAFVMFFHSSTCYFISLTSFSLESCVTGVFLIETQQKSFFKRIQAWHMHTEGTQTITAKWMQHLWFTVDATHREQPVENIYNWFRNLGFGELLS